MVKFGNGWDGILGAEFEKDYYKKLREFLKNEYGERVIYPKAEDIYNCFRLTPLEKVKVVILGQDPYHGAGQAHGLCFSVSDGVPPPPSLMNIFKELKADIGCTNFTGNLTKWAKQGVLLLNTVLSVREGQPLSHKNRGWEILTDRVISALNEREIPTVFMLWGNNARIKKSLLSSKTHLILEACHPSPLSVTGFLGCHHFSKANKFLEVNGIEPIDWML